MLVSVGGQLGGTDPRRIAPGQRAGAVNFFGLCLGAGSPRGLAAIAALGIALAALVVIGEARAQAGESSQPRGLPPAPTYIPGTEITPAVGGGQAKKGAAKTTERTQRSARAAARPETSISNAPAPPAPTPEASAGEASVPGAPPAQAVEIRAAASEAPTVRPATPAAVPSREVRTDDPVWQKVLPYLPDPGEFAVIPGSALAPVLVKDGEFDFCSEIKCYRSAAVIGAWNGGAFDERRGEFRVHGGGHADYGGNEVYVFDFATLSWTRETEPQPLTGPFLRDSDGDGKNDACPAPASGPPATHTYSGFVYVPKIDRYWLFGTVEYCSNGMGGSSAWEYDAHSKTWTALPQFDAFGRFARAVVDPRSGNVIVHIGRKHGWHEIDPERLAVVRSFKRDPFGTFIDGPAVFDDREGTLYTLVEGRSTDRLVAYTWPAPGESKGFDGRLVKEWPKGGKKAWGIAQDSAGELMLWDGNARVITVDPQSGDAKELEPGGQRYASMGDATKPGKVYSKWTYVEALDTFFGITNPNLGVVLYRPARAERAATATAGVDVARVDVAGDDASDDKPLPKRLASRPPLPSGGQADGVPLTIEEVADWRAVCATAILCDPMGEGEVIYRGEVVASGPPEREVAWRSIGQKFNHPEAELPTADPEVGGLRFTFPSNSGSGVAGNFKTNFSPDYSLQVGPADAGAPVDEVFIQFQVRYSCSFIWTDCEPSSPNYRKERRCFLDKGGKGGCTASKIALISTGDRDGERADACTRIQTAINHGSDHSLHAFHRCPRAQGFGVRLPRVGGRYQGNSQPNGLFYCPRILGDYSESGWNNTADTCFRLVDDRWITIQIHLRFGPWQAGAKKGAPSLSHVSIWGGIEDVAEGRQQLVIDRDFKASRPSEPRDFVGKIWLMPHLYNKTPQEDHPPFFVWYRNLIVSETLIPNPI